MANGTFDGDLLSAVRDSEYSALSAFIFRRSCWFRNKITHPCHPEPLSFQDCNLLMDSSRPLVWMGSTLSTSASRSFLRDILPECPLIVSVEEGHSCSGSRWLKKENCMKEKGTSLHLAYRDGSLPQTSLFLTFQLMLLLFPFDGKKGWKLSYVLLIYSK